MAAVREHETRTVNAWRQKPQLLGQALDLARAGHMKPLHDYIASTPLTMDEQLVLARFYRSQQKRGRGRPKNLNRRGHAYSQLRDNARDALHNAAYLVRLRQQAWLRENPSRKNVPREITEGFISEAIDVAEKTFGTRPDRTRLWQVVDKK